MAKNKYSIKDILDNVGVLYPFEHISSICKYNADEKSITQFIEEMHNIINTYGNYGYKISGISNKFFSECEKLYKNNANIIDVPSLIFITAIQVGLDIKDPKAEDSLYIPRVFLREEKEREKANEYIRKALESVNTVLCTNEGDVIEALLPKVYLNPAEYSIEENGITRIDNTKCIPNYEQKMNLLEIAKEQDIDFGYLLKYTHLKDLQEIFEYPQIGKAVMDKMLEKGKKLKEGTHLEEVPLQQELIEQYNLRHLSNDIRYMQIRTNSIDGPNIYVDGGTQQKYDVLDFMKVTEHVRIYLDLKKFMIITAQRQYERHGSNLADFTQDEIKELNDFCERVGTILQESEIFDENSQNYEEEFKKVMKNVDNLNKHFLFGKYHNSEEIRELASLFCDGTRNLEDLSKEEIFEKIRFSYSEIGKMYDKSPENFEKLLNLGYITKDIIKKLISEKESIKANQLSVMYMQDLIDSKEFIDLYLKSDENLEILKSLKEDEAIKEKLEKELTEEQLVDLFLNPDNKEEFEKYSKLFKLFKIDGKGLYEQEEIADSILEKSDDLLQNDNMFNLYNLGLIPIDKIVDYMGTDGVIALYKDGKLKHEDAKRMYDSQILTIDSLQKLLSTPDMGDDEKLILIYSAFSEEQYSNLRNTLIETISNVEVHNAGSKNYKNGGRTPNPMPNPNVISSKYVSDPCTRWNLMAKLDPNYQVEYCKRDGHAIIHLPTLDKHIIERIFEKDTHKTGTHKWAYGYATYIINGVEYNQQINEIAIRDNNGELKAINRSALVNKAKNSKEIEKVVHTGWGKKMCEAFDVDTQSLYSEENRTEIHNLAEQVEKSKKMII